VKKSNHNPLINLPDHSTQAYLRADEPPEGETLKLLEDLRKIPTKPWDPTKPKPVRKRWDFSNWD
jgi:hypothetical protein